MRTGKAYRHSSKLMKPSLFKSISSKKPFSLRIGTDRPARWKAARSSSLLSLPSLSLSMDLNSRRSCLSAASTKTRNSSLQRSQPLVPGCLCLSSIRFPPNRRGEGHAPSY
ncbi:hypothetical protein N656DRAFT_780919 [Canariomyces notabilis]|uniref:Uncharacterized protein n=1 Tax=Canariomyces notabilis TaxID=2074819 RepID=A0AAN6YPL9_9PEZI|nr:hypothetical protein N656DRAFT_780919 [Canariomyces arenarius]